MINVIHKPIKNTDKNYQIEGDNINELVDFCLTKIRTKSQEFYKKELLLNLKEERKSIIDCHAGMGIYYDVVLK